MPTQQTHWDDAYDSGGASVSWFQPEATKSIELISSVAGTDNSVLDVGGGSSPLVDALLAAGYADVAVMDVSAKALALTQARLGDAAAKVDWIVADLLAWDAARSFDVWHDRAVLHFLIAAEQSRRYVELLRLTLAPGGHAVIGVFAEDGPERCSGLPVRRYSGGQLAALLGEDFETVAASRELHVTPGGKEQPFNWIVVRRSP